MREKLSDITLSGFGVKKDSHNSLFVQPNELDFAMKKHNIIQAILSINDLFCLSGSNVKNLFFEDVENWLKNNKIHFTNRIGLIGKSGYHHNFDYQIRQ